MSNSTRRAGVGLIGIGAIVAMAYISAAAVDESSGVETMSSAVRAIPGNLPYCDTEEFAQATKAPNDTIKSSYLSAATMYFSESNDCQRLIHGTTLGPLVALLVAQGRLEQAAAFSTGRVAAELVNYYGHGYDHLGIPPGLSCLWLERAGMNWKARILVPGSNQTCLDANLNNTGSGEPLVVRPRQHNGPNQKDYPLTGRWMWDATNLRQFIGIGVRGAWLEIGRAGFVSQTPHVLTPDGVPGWSDEQLLTYMPQGATELALSRLWGRIEPSKRKYDLHEERYEVETGIHVATITLTGNDQPARAAYAAKFGLRCSCVNDILVYMRRWPLFTGGPSVIEYSYDHSDPSKWRRAFYNGHSMHAGTGAVRWAWSEKDEDGWVQCYQGCCRTCTPGTPGCN